MEWWDMEDTCITLQWTEADSRQGKVKQNDEMTCTEHYWYKSRSMSDEAEFNACQWTRSTQGVLQVMDRLPGCVYISIKKTYWYGMCINIYSVVNWPHYMYGISVYVNSCPLLHLEQKCYLDIFNDKFKNHNMATSPHYYYHR